MPNPSLTAAEAVLPEPITVPAWAWLLVAAALMASYLVSLDNGLVLGHAATVAHEFFHDARHFIGAPCH